MNCLALEVAEQILVVDCGVTFPKSDLGIDTYHPDFSWLEERHDRIRGLVITHGHEDHIGAIPYFAKRFDVPIWGPRYALSLAKLRLEEHGFEENEVELIPSHPRQRFAVGAFEVEPIRVAHSIVDATALTIRTPAGTVLHTGDFKLDDEPGDGETTDEERLAEIGDEGVRLLLSDSTNIESHGRSGSERLAAEKLAALIEGAPHRVIIGMFASNMHRVSAVARAAARAGRKMVLLGRSVGTHVRIATELKRLDLPSDLFVSPDQAMALPRNRVLCIASGTQAEKLAALTRISRRAHQGFRLDEGDRVILSSRIIPGNEPAVMDMIAGLLRLGAEIRTPISDPGVHVSGHAYRDEQARMIDLTKPEAFVPVHGTLLHLHRHAALAREKGVPEVLVLENGQIGDVAERTERSNESAYVGKIPTWDGEPIPPQVLHDRETIARSGIAFVTVLVDVKGRLVCPPAIATRGVLDEKEGAWDLRDIAKEISRALSERPRPLDEDVAEVVRAITRRKLEQAAGKKPITVASVLRARP